MSITTVIQAIKQVHTNDVVFVKIGKFYHVYGKDSYILSYLFEYKIKKVENNCSTCGFPEDSFAKVKSKLEHMKINYLVVDRRNNYDVEDKVDNKNLNKYEATFANAHKYVNLKNRIDNIHTYLIKNIKNENIRQKIVDIENILNEGRKI